MQYHRSVFPYFYVFVTNLYHSNIYIIIGGEDYQSDEPAFVLFSYGITDSGSLAIFDDNIFEANESFILTIDSSTLPNRVLVQPDCMLVVTIVDNDGELLHCYNM